MSTSAVPAVFDYLVSTFTTAVANLALPEVPNVYDGPVVGTPTPDFVTVGSGSDADASDAASRDWASLGTGTRGEEFVVACYVYSARGGTDQKETRDAAFLIFNALETAIRNDPTLGGIVKYLGADFTTQNVKQTPPPTPGETPSGRWTLIEFGVRVRNRY